MQGLSLLEPWGRLRLGDAYGCLAETAKWELATYCGQMGVAECVVQTYSLEKTLYWWILEEFWSPKTINRLAIGDLGPF